MNVFVLSTGRCGTTTFANACQGIDNFTATHESERIRNYGNFTNRYQTLKYPKNHIEIDNRLSWFLGFLEKEYGKNAYYVHLLRDREEVSRSFLERWKQRKTNIIFSFAWGILTHPYDMIENLSEEDRLLIGRQYWDTVNSNIRSFLKDKPLQSTLWLNDIKPGFKLFWHSIGAQGDIDKALGAWDTIFNEGVKKSSDTADQDVRYGNVELSSPTLELMGDDMSSIKSNSGMPETSGPIDGAADNLQCESTLVEENQLRINCALSAADSFKISKSIPHFETGAWTLTPEAIRFLANLVIQTSPEKIIEFGSGLSTRVLQWACSQLNKAARITTIDHDSEFIELSKSQSIVDSSNVKTSFIFAPLVARKIAGRNLPIYHLPPFTFAEPGKADLIVIDGPPRALGGRQGILYQAMDFARPGTLVLLDDAKRPGEKEAIQQWCQVFGEKIHVDMLPGFAKGLAAITIVEPVMQADLSHSAISPPTRKLLSLISEDSNWIVVDDHMSEPAILENPCILPFTERNGEYYGHPRDDAHAIAELERLRSIGARHIAFLSQSFWWLEHFTGLKRYLDSTYALALSQRDLIIYDLSEVK